MNFFDLQQVSSRINEKGNMEIGYCATVFGVPYFVADSLPFPELVVVCDVETREEVIWSTGKMIHAVRFDGRLCISRELEEKLRQQLPIR